MNFLMGIHSIYRFVSGETKKRRPYPSRRAKGWVPSVLPRIDRGPVSLGGHHILGMDISTEVPAINEGPNEIILGYADYGIVDELFGVFPR